MSKVKPKKIWFDELETIHADTRFAWLTSIAGDVQKIAHFGASDGVEAYTLLWSLDADQIDLIDLEEKQIQKAKELKENLETISETQHAFDGRTITFHTEDMTETIPSLLPDTFDLSYCGLTLKYLIEGSGGIAGSEEKLKKGINQMIRVTRPGGWIVISEPERVHDNIKHFFEAQGCELVSLAPSDVLCYRKPQI